MEQQDINQNKGLWVRLDNAHLKKDEHCNMSIDLFDETDIKEILKEYDNIPEFLVGNSFDIVFKVPQNMAIVNQLRFLANQIEQNIKGEYK